MRRYARTEAQLTDPAILLRPMTWDEWFLRTMILEKQRRDKVLAGRVDPTPFEPWKICSPEDMKEWLKSNKERTVEARQVTTHRDNYGMKGGAKQTARKGYGGRANESL